MRRDVPFLVIAALVISLHPLAAHAQGTGRSLDIQPGARQNGMGAAGVALLGDPTAGLWWNPAMLAFGRRPDATMTYAKLVPGLANDVKYYNGGVTVPVGHVVGMGLGYTHLSYGRDFGTPDFHAREETPAVSAGVRATPELAFGATAKFIDIAFAPGGAASTTGIDLGALYRHRLDDFTVAAGVMAQNLGPKVKFGGLDEGSPLTRNVRFGIAADYASPPTRDGLEFGAAFALDRFQSILPGGNDANYATTHYGGEVSLGLHRVARVALRAGYYDDPEGQIQDPTFGVGGRVLGLTVDFASIPQAHDSGLERVKKWTFGYHFDPLPRGRGDI
jgi:hypothetical protein